MRQVTNSQRWLLWQVWLQMGVKKIINSNSRFPAFHNQWITLTLNVVKTWDKNSDDSARTETRTPVKKNSQFDFLSSINVSTEFKRWLTSLHLWHRLDIFWSGKLFDALADASLAIKHSTYPQITHFGQFTVISMFICRCSSSTPWTSSLKSTPSSPGVCIWRLRSLLLVFSWPISNLMLTVVLLIL